MNGVLGGTASMFLRTSAAMLMLVCALAGGIPTNAASQTTSTSGVAPVHSQAAPDVWFQTTAIFERLSERAADFVIFLPLLIVAIIVFFAFVGTARWSLRRSRAFERLTTNPFQLQILTQSAHVVIVVIGLVFALEILDATSLIGAVLGAAGATGIVLGFALKETLENYVAGLLLSLRQPFAPFDHIVVLDYEGHVVRLTSRATVLMTLEGNHVRIPNADVLKNPLVNYSRNPERRFDFEIGIGVDVDLVEARKLAIEILSVMRGVLDTPEPDAWIQALGDSNVAMKIVGWVDQREFSLNKVRGEAIRRIKAAFEAADFDMPEPIYRLKLMKKDGGETEIPATAAPAQSYRAAGPTNDNGDEIDIARDDHVERQVAKERSEMPQEDLLNPMAQQE